MFDRLEDLARSLEEINMQLTDPDVINDQNKYRQLMKEQSELTPIVEKYQEYRAAKDGIEESLQILEEENDEEMRELAKEELAECRETVEKCEQELKILMLPKDPNDDKNVIVEIVAVPVEMRRHFLRQICSGCILNLRRQTTGRSK